MEELKELGLTNKEIEIYVALIKYGPSTIWEISSKIHIKRTSIYDLIKALMEKNIILKQSKGKKIIYAPVEPEYLLELMNIKKEAIIDAVSKLSELKKSSTLSKNKVITYNGVVGIRTIANMILQEENQVLRGFGSNYLSQKILRFYPENFAQKRIDKNIELRAIIEPGSRFYAENEQFYKKTRIKQHLLMKSQKTVVFLINGKTIIFSLNKLEPTAVFIEEQDLYDSQKNIFEHFWKEAK